MMAPRPKVWLDEEEEEEDDVRECVGVVKAHPLGSVSWSLSPYCSGGAEGTGKEGQYDDEIDVAGGREMLSLRAKSGFR